MKIEIMALVLILVMTPTISYNSSQHSTEILTQEEGVKILAIVANGFGWNYFDIKDCFDAWDVNFTTAGLTVGLDVDSCYNREPRPITADLRVHDLDEESIAEFDCVIIPSGGHWNSLYSSSRVLDLIIAAYDQGVVVSSICVGNTPLAKGLNDSENLVDGTMVAYYSRSNALYREAGADPVLGARVVSDNGLVTGGTGGGYPGGFESAPTNETCAAIMREIQGISWIENVTLTEPEEGEDYSLSVEVDDFSDIGDLEPWVFPIEVDEIFATVHLKSNSSESLTIDLTDDDSDGVFTGSFTMAADGDYSIIIGIEDTYHILDVERNAAEFTIGNGISENPDLILPIAIVGAAAVVVVLVVLLRKRGV